MTSAEYTKKANRQMIMGLLFMFWTMLAIVLLAPNIDYVKSFEPYHRYAYYTFNTIAVVWWLNRCQKTENGSDFFTTVYFFFFAPIMVPTLLSYGAYLKLKERKDARHSD